MLNKELLRAKMVSERYSIRAFAKALDLSDPTMARRLSGKCDFKVGEIDKMRELLRLTDLEIIEFFFAKK